MNIDKEALKAAADEVLKPLGIAIAIMGALALEVWLCRNMLWLVFVLLILEFAVAVFIMAYKGNKEVNDLMRKDNLRKPTHQTI